MPIDYSEYPPNWKTEIRPRIIARAKNCCEDCGVKNHSVGYRKNGLFIPTAGNATHDAAGRGELPYKEALELVRHCNSCCDDKLTLIVLTVAHLNHDKLNWDVKDEDLKALCQRCHLKLDLAHHVSNRKYGRNHGRKEQLKIEL